MLPAVPDFLASLRKEMNDAHATEKDIKVKMKLLTVKVDKEVEGEVAKGKKRARLEGDSLGRTADAWGYVKRSLRLNQPKMENVLLDGKVLMNNREVLAKIQSARRDLQSINYQISFDAKQREIDQGYVQAMPKHSV